jgi:hypothetical protein
MGGGRVYNIQSSFLFQKIIVYALLS